MKKILFLLTSSSIFGADLSILTNVNYLQKEKKIDPIFIIREKGKLEKYLKKKKYKYFIIPFYFWVSKKRTFFKSFIKLVFNFLLAIYAIVLLRNQRINYIYTNTFTTNFGIILSALKRSKHIFHIRELPKAAFNWEFDYSSKFIFFISKKLSYRLFVNSEYLQRMLQKDISKKLLKIVPNSIDKKFVQKNKYQFQRKVKLLFVGRLDADKNPLMLINTAKYILKKNRNFVIDVYGDGQLKEELSNKINSNKLNNFIKIKDYEANIHKITKNYHIGLSISTFDTFNRTIVEYMKSGLTVIANNSGNNKNLFINGKTGILINNLNSSILSKKIIYLLNRKKIIKKIGSNAYLSSKNKFGVKDSCKKLEKYLSL
ncbi:glycosyltransferase [Candidatus Pelagibacter ubique]|nr:glycosyltransferase [Candidatus Pelagibacter ubique]